MVQIGNSEMAMAAMKKKIPSDPERVPGLKKAKNVIALCQKLIEEHQSQVPNSRDRNKAVSRADHRSSSSANSS